MKREKAFYIVNIIELGYQKGMNPVWKLNNPDPGTVLLLQRSLGCHRAVATALANRNITNPKEANSFLSTSLSNLEPAFFLTDMEPAIKRIEKAVKNAEPILIFGDYDADGIAATSLLYLFFKEIGALADYYIPDRRKEGYGLKKEHVEDALAKNFKLILTVDCGINSFEAALACRKRGIDLIITDHHKMGKSIPQATAVINPDRESESHASKNMAGVGVAFCLAIALRRHLRGLGFWNRNAEPNLKDYLDLVAIGTVADMVPLRGNNRIFVKSGLKIMQSAPRPGIAALMNRCGTDPLNLKCEDLAFKLIPRINAAGRMESPMPALRLLVSKDHDQALALARQLNDYNRLRQEDERGIFEEISQHIRSNPALLNRSSLVFWSTKWNEGVLGIVASRLARRYHKPSILMVHDRITAKGSCRSIPGIDIYDALCSCSELLSDFGGHSMAAGITLDARNLEDFNARIDSEIKKALFETGVEHILSIDCELSFDEITPALMDELAALEPFGTGNEEPVFMASDIRVIKKREVGGNHCHLLLSQSKNRSDRLLSALWFHPPSRWREFEHFRQMAFKAHWNHYNGSKNIQLIVAAAK